LTGALDDATGDPFLLSKCPKQLAISQAEPLEQLGFGQVTGKHHFAEQERQLVLTKAVFFHQVILVHPGPDVLPEFLWVYPALRHIPTPILKYLSRSWGRAIGLGTCYGSGTPYQKRAVRSTHGLNLV
jgi:hypothetical protein